MVLLRSTRNVTTQQTAASTASRTAPITAPTSSSFAPPSTRTLSEQPHHERRSQTFGGSRRHVLGTHNGVAGQGSTGPDSQPQPDRPISFSQIRRECTDGRGFPACRLLWFLLESRWECVVYISDNPHPRAYKTSWRLQRISRTEQSSRRDSS